MNQDPERVEHEYGRKNKNMFKNCIEIVENTIKST
jgi:hypothetical protein